MASGSQRSLWRGYLDFPLIWKFAIALVLGAVVGLIVGPSISVIQPLGDIFLRLLQMLIVPIVLFTLVVGRVFHKPRAVRVGWE